MWTAVPEVIFVDEAYAGLANAAEFDNLLLGLPGISAGACIGLQTTSAQAKWQSPSFDGLYVSLWRIADAAGL